MSLLDNKEAIKSLKNSFKRGELTLYLGAGVSIPSGLPSWEHLVLLIYFRTLHADINMNVYSNYLLAVAEWMLREKKDPLDVVIRKIRKTWSDNDFMDVLRESLYGNIRDSTGRVFFNAINRNKTLQSIVSDLLNKSVLKSRGVRTVITYNYDNLLQLALERKKIDKKFQTIYKDVPEYKLNKIPIYHVHGYLPIQKTTDESMPDELVFSEERYNSIFQDSYYWGNMIQTQNLSSNTGLMIGISLSDKNIRRLLDAIKKAPIARNNYILMKRSALKEPLEGSEDLAFIKDRARKWMDKMANSGIKKESQEYSKIRNVVRDIVDFETSNFANIYTDLGIQVLLYDRHEEIPGFIKKISAR